MKLHNERLHALSRRLDPVWRVVARALRLPHYDGRGNPESILVVHVHLLGDIVMLIPFLRVIRRGYPRAHVGLVAGPWARTILEDSGLVDEFIQLRAPWIAKDRRLAGIRNLVRAVRTSRRRQWEWGIDMRGDVRNILILALARAKRRVAYDFSGGSALLTDVVSDNGELRHIIDHHVTIAEHLGISMSAQDRIPTLVRKNDSRRTTTVLKRRVGFHFGASMALRRMPVEEACALMLSIPDRHRACFILVDAPDTGELNQAVLHRLPAAFAANVERWAGDLREFMGFLAGLDEFFAMDSGPAHLAAALGIDTTVFFGPHVPLAVRPLGHNVTIVERSELPCRPCDQHRCTNPTYQACLRDIVRPNPEAA